jgi:alkanesulfonate monooxygenase SsuD/methylene tetrahydromethanopterin reductase-like flavin-dependent oxidoreductase (luciferase family)
MRFSLFTVVDHYEDGARSLYTRYEQLVDQIVEADRLGFEAFWIGEHHGYLTPHLALTCPNPAIVLSAAAQRTRRIGLNTAIANLSLRHPLLLAEDYSLVDVLSQGRLGLGIGRGSYPHEYAIFGLEGDESRGRFEESWEIINLAWSGEAECAASAEATAALLVLSYERGILYRAWTCCSTCYCDATFKRR